MLKELRRSRIFIAGAVLLAAGTSPLLLYIAYELLSGSSGGNPVGLGLLFFVSFWPAVLLMAAGAVVAFRRHARGRSEPRDD